MSPREHRIHIERPEGGTHDKILFSDDGFTKRDLVDYYCRIPPWILPHLRGRPVAMERYPDGINRPGFFHKSAPASFPECDREGHRGEETGRHCRQVVCNGAATLAYLATRAA